MNFNNAYEILTKVPYELISNVNEQITKCANYNDFNYKDKDTTTKEDSWFRMDFMKPPTKEHLVPIYQSIMNAVNYISNSTNIDPVNSVSLSLLRPNQVLAEHTDGRFIHRITNRYLVPLTDSKINYNYGYINGEKIVYQLEQGNVYRINNAIIHSALNLENEDRYNLLIDCYEQRLKDKFKDHPDLFHSLTMIGVNKEFEKRLKVK